MFQWSASDARARLSTTRVHRKRLPPGNCERCKESADLRPRLSAEAIGLQIVSNQAEVMQHQGSSRDKDVIRRARVRAEKRGACLRERDSDSTRQWRDRALAFNLFYFDATCLRNRSYYETNRSYAKIVWTLPTNGTSPMYFPSQRIRIRRWYFFRIFFPSSRIFLLLHFWMLLLLLLLLFPRIIREIKLTNLQFFVEIYNFFFRPEFFYFYISGCCYYYCYYYCYCYYYFPELSETLKWPTCNLS